jgi:hypothetical protein
METRRISDVIAKGEHCIPIDGSPLLWQNARVTIRV